ncbi:hypothetical protein [Vibrio albus]|nr:hypothetical protein [Vibrio albus]
MTRQNLLQQEKTIITQWLNKTAPGTKHVVELGPSGNSMQIENFPLTEDSCIELLLILDRYPESAPMGIYIRNSPENKRLIQCQTGTSNSGTCSASGSSFWMHINFEPAPNWAVAPEDLGKKSSLLSFLKSIQKKHSQFNR